MLLRNRARQEGRIEKPEDREWKKWYDTLDIKEHEKKLAMLGLDKEDIKEWENHSVFQDLDQEAGFAESKDSERELKKKKQKP